MDNFNETNIAFVSLAGTTVMLLLAICMNSTTKEDDWAHAKIRELEERIEAEVADYNKLVDEHNKLLEEKEAVERENSENIDDYNKLVEQHNSLLDDNTQLEERVEYLEGRIAILESRIRRNFNYKS